MMGVKPARHKPTRVEYAKVTNSNMDLLAEWINGNQGAAYVSTDDEKQELWINAGNRGWILAHVGNVIIKGFEEFYPITEEVFLNSYEDIPMEG